MAMPERRRASPLFHSEKKPDPLRQLGIMSLNGMFDEMDGVSVLRQATEILADDLAIVPSFGADSAVLLHMVAQVDKAVPVYFLETGKHFPETLAYRRDHQAASGPDQHLAPRARSAKDLARFDPNGELGRPTRIRCCHIRKTEPLDAVMEGFGGWVTGRKRYQTKERGVLPHFELTSDDRIKVNPLAYFSDADEVNAYHQSTACPSIRCSLRATSPSAARLARRSSPRARIPRAGLVAGPQQERVRHPL